MSKVLVTESNLANIANAIRGKNGQATQYKPSEMPAAIEAIPAGITPSGTVNITQNGTTDVTDYASAAVNVPNTYTAEDEGKVVSSGALVAQSAHAEITQNGTYDTTENNSVTVNVSGGGGGEPGEVIFQQYKGQSGGSTQTIYKSYTVTKAGYYYLSSGGWLDQVNIKVNGTQVSQTYFAEYSQYRYATRQLAVGDVIEINTYGSGRLAIHGLIIFLHS